MRLKYCSGDAAAFLEDAVEAVAVLTVTRADSATESQAARSRVSCFGSRVARSE
jgi:hypothetical protein